MRAQIQSLTKNKNFNELLFSSIFINLLSLALPFSMLQIYDRILPNEAYGTANVLLLGVAVAILLEVILRYVRSWFLASAAANYEFDVTAKLITRLLKADYQYLQSLGSGKILSGLKSVSSVRDLYSGQAAIAFMDIPFTLIFLALIAYIGGWVVLVPVVVWCIAGLWVWRVSNKLLEVTQDLAVTESERTRILVLVLSGVATVKALALEARMTYRYKDVNHENLKKQNEVDWQAAKLQELIQGASLGTTLALVIVGCLAVLDGQMTTGGLAACSILAGRSVAPLSALGSLRAKLVTARAASQDIEDLINAPQEQFTAQTVYQSKLPSGPISFTNVSVSKVGASLSDINLSIPSGSITVVNSNPMSYASLLLSSLGAYHQPEQGTIAIAGVPLYEHDEFEFRQSVSYVAPWGTLFHGTVLENMTFFRHESEPYAMELADRLGLSDTISQLPYGFQTPVGRHDNASLNKGAIKLISLIRALSQKPSILLLDEPMVSIDADSQSRLLSLLNEKRGDMTIIIASYFDEVIALSDSQISLSIEGRLSSKQVTGES